MKRLTQEDLNTPERFDWLWSLTELHHFDRVRMEAFTNYVKNGQKVLDVGAGMFSWGEYLLSGNQPVEVHAIDFSPYAMKVVTARQPDIKYFLGNVLDMPYGDDVFDVVGSGEVIEHMEIPQDLVREMVRVCKPGGLLIVGTVDPDCEDAIRNGCAYPEHIWQFSPEELIGLFMPYGITEYRRVGNYDFVYCRKH